jgi:hypothetical protein
VTASRASVIALSRAARGACPAAGTLCLDGRSTGTAPGSRRAEEQLAAGSGDQLAHPLGLVGADVVDHHHPPRGSARRNRKRTPWRWCCPPPSWPGSSRCARHAAGGLVPLGRVQALARAAGRRSPATSSPATRVAGFGGERRGVCGHGDIGGGQRGRVATRASAPRCRSAADGPDTDPIECTDTPNRIAACSWIWPASIAATTRARRSIERPAPARPSTEQPGERCEAGLHRRLRQAAGTPAEARGGRLTPGGRWSCAR